MSQNKTDTSVPSGAGDNAASKSDSTGSTKAAARKKLKQQNNQKSNPPTKKKSQQPPVKSAFAGIASGVSPMKGVVIANGNGNKAGQFRVFQKKLAGAAADNKAYGLDSAILDLIAKKRSDFIKPKPDPISHSNLTPVMEADNVTPTGEIKLACFDPVMKD
jgi:phage tail tape-measure protein